MSGQQSLRRHKDKTLDCLPSSKSIDVVADILIRPILGKRVYALIPKFS
jgi:hypothetical protein